MQAPPTSRQLRPRVSPEYSLRAVTTVAISCPIEILKRQWHHAVARAQMWKRPQACKRPRLCASRGGGGESSICVREGLPFLVSQSDALLRGAFTDNEDCNGHQYQQQQIVLIHASRRRNSPDQAHTKIFTAACARFPQDVSFYKGGLFRPPSPCRQIPKLLAKRRLG